MNTATKQAARLTPAGSAVRWIAAAFTMAAASTALATPRLGQDDARTLAPRARVEAGATEIHVGDRLELDIAVEHDPGSRVAWPGTFDVGPFELIEIRPGPARIDGDRSRSEATLVLTAFELGALEIPSLELPVIDAAGAETLVATDPYGVLVSSIGLDESGEIRDLKGPRSIARDWLLLWPWALGLLLAVLAGWWLARRVRSRPEPSVPTRPAPPSRPAHEIAYARLAELEASTMLERGLVKDYYVAVAEIVREYLEGRYGISALEMTTGEILAQLRSADLEPDLVDDFGRFLRACDLVKFAKHSPGAEDRAGVVPHGRRLVDATRPREPEVADAPGSTGPSGPEPKHPSLETGEARA